MCNDILKNDLIFWNNPGYDTDLFLPYPQPFC